MNDLRTLFIRWFFNEFQQNPLFSTMEKVSENSPWHRESTVAIHTNMVVAEYLGLAHDDACVDSWAMEDLYGAFAAAFHDVGKPAARTEAYKPERGTYYRYGGHELISARLWEDWAVQNFDFLVEEFNFTVDSIYCVGWLIENHMPWSITKSEKRKYLALGAMRTIGYVDYFINFLKADQWGRISDDADAKRRDVNEWCDNFAHFYETAVSQEKYRYLDEDAPTLHMLIGASGSGKSTYTADSGIDAVFSLDQCRIKMYVEGKNIPSAEDPYSVAFQKSCEDKTFRTKTNALYYAMLRTGEDIIVDNVNVSRKNRAWYINEAKRYGYRIKAVLFPISLQEVLDRQHTRKDKTVPEDAVRGQYMRLSYPSLGEVDEIEVVGSNL